MEKLKYTEKLAKTLLIAGGILLAGGLVWYFSDVVIYIAISGVIALIAKPLMHIMRKVRIRKWRLPDWLMTLISMTVIFGIASVIFLKIIPVLGKTLTDIASLDLQSAADTITVYLQQANSWALEHISGLAEDFNIQEAITQWLQKIINLDLLTSLTGSVAGFMMDFGIGLFAVTFISFFFIKDGDLVVHLITSTVPDKLENSTKEAIHDIEYLLSRYFGGILIEITCITLLNFTGLHFIADLNSNAALTMAAITGIFNIIPYVGPLAGGILGTVIGVLTKILYTTGPAAEVHIGTFILLLIAIFVVTHLIDVFFFQPYIYSSSIKANALEIFIVILMAGTIGGPLGMLVAVPGYTVIRVIAMKFFGDKKAVKTLMK